MERVLSHAKAQGYTAYTSTLVEPWRISVAGLTRAIREALAVGGQRPDVYPADVSPTGDPIAVFAILEAGRHRSRGVSLALFWGLLKYYRRAYLELLDEQGPPDPEGRHGRDFVAACFERMEYAFVLAWTELSGHAERDALARTNLLLANDKNKYLTVFESIPMPLFLLDAQGRVANCNKAALALTGHAAPTAPWPMPRPKAVSAVTAGRSWTRNSWRFYPGSPRPWPVRIRTSPGRTGVPGVRIDLGQ
jgi:PAS domain-containing protein